MAKDTVSARHVLPAAWRKMQARHRGQPRADMRLYLGSKMLRICSVFGRYTTEPRGNRGNTCEVEWSVRRSGSAAPLSFQPTRNPPAPRLPSQRRPSSSAAAAPKGRRNKRTACASLGAQACSIADAAGLARSGLTGSVRPTLGPEPWPAAPPKLNQIADAVKRQRRQRILSR